MPQNTSEPVPTPVEVLRERVARAEKASFLHKGEEAVGVARAAIAVVEDLDGRVAQLESRLNSIEHPARDRPRDQFGRFLPLDD